MISRLILVAVGFNLVLPLMGDSIELWNGQKAENVEVLGVAEGILYIRHKGKEAKIPVTKVKNWISTDKEYRITHYASYKYKRSRGKILSIAVNPELGRISQPYIRVFACEKNEKGEYILYEYQNHRVNDPTRSHDLPQVDAKSYARKHYFVDRENLIASRIEIWQDGQLRQTQEEIMDEQLPAGWYRHMEVKSTRQLDMLEQDEIADVEAAITAEEQAPPASASVEVVSTLPEFKEQAPTVEVTYSLISRKAVDKVEVPKVLFHYVTKNKDGRMEIGSLSVESEAGQYAPVIQGRVNRKAEKKMSGNIRATEREMLMKAGLTELIYWRVEIAYGDGEEMQVVASKEKDHAKVKKSLPSEWWK